MCHYVGENNTMTYSNITGHFHLGVQIWPATDVYQEREDRLKPTLVSSYIHSAPILSPLLIYTYVEGRGGVAWGKLY